MAVTFALACAIPFCAWAQSAVPSGYTEVFKYAPGNSAEVANGYPYYTGIGSPAWFYNVEQCCGGDPQRSFTAYSNVPACATTATDPFKVTKVLQIELQYHAKVSGCGSDPYGFWTGGILTSLDANQTHGKSWFGGYFVCNARLPGPNTGFWPSCWMLSTNRGRTEVDIFENYTAFKGSTGLPTYLNITFTDHITGAGATCAVDLSVQYPNINLQSSFNQFGILWSPTSTSSGRITPFFNQAPIKGCRFNGQPSYTYTHDPNWGYPMEFIIDLGVGGAGGRNAPGVPSDLPTNSSLQILNASVWQPR
jgi:hypothetical protein